MAVRYRKSIKIAPGVKVNINKKSVGLSVGTKGARYTVNSKGRRTSTVGIPGTGVSYVSTSSSKNKNKKSKSTKSNYTSEPTIVTTTYVNGKTVNEFKQEQEKAKLKASKREREAHEQERKRQLRKKRLANNQTLKRFFPKQVPKEYWGNYTHTKRYISIACVLAFILTGYYSIFLIPFAVSLYFRFFWHRDDEARVVAYRKARRYFKNFNYILCLHYINSLTSSGNYHSELDYAKQDCYLKSKNISIENINSIMQELSDDLFELENSSDIEFILTAHADISKKYNKFKFDTTLNEAFVNNDLYNNFTIDIKELYSYLNNAINRNVYQTYVDAKDLKTEKGKINRCLSYLSSLQSYNDRFPLETLKYISQVNNLQNNNVLNYIISNDNPTIISLDELEVIDTCTSDAIMYDLSEDWFFLFFYK